MYSTSIWLLFMRTVGEMDLGTVTADVCQCLCVPIEYFASECSILATLDLFTVGL